MKKIASFTIDHIRLKPGIYVSRKDNVNGSVITTFDIRMTSPNDEPVMNTAEVHTIEHLGATFLRNHEEWQDRVIYFGPMGYAGPVFICFSQEIIHPVTSFLSCRKCIHLSRLSRVMSPVRPQKTAEIIWI